MKRTLICVLLLLSITAANICVAAPFKNLDFEEAVIVKHDPTFGFLDWSLAVPGWSHDNGPDSGIVYYSQGHFGTTPLHILIDVPSKIGWQLPIDGHYSLFSRSEIYFGDRIAYISQTGDIPSDARSLQFLATSAPNISIGGQPLLLKTLDHIGSATLYGTGVMNYAGTTAELKVSWPWNAGGTVDDFVFSPVAVPEPSTLLLGAVAAAFFFGLVRRRVES